MILALVLSVVASDGVTARVSAQDARSEMLDQIEPMVQRAITAGDLPGAVIAIADTDQTLYLRAFGHKQLSPQPIPLATDAVFDLASITKPVATACSVMRLHQDGLFELGDPVSQHLPEFTGNGKESITIEQLLLHTSGLTPDNALSDYLSGPEKAWKNICALPLRSSPGEKFSYSDVGFIVLGKLVEKLSSQPLDRYARDRIFQPLKMKETMFRPDAQLRPRCVPTEKRDGKWIRGEVHDPRSWELNGVAGHAGLFSTAEDLVRFGQSFLRSETSEHPVFAPRTIAAMTLSRKTPRGTRCLGWDHRSPYSRNRGESLSESAFGHGGFTGTVLWIDPEKQRVFVFLSSRLHPDGKGSVNTLAGKIATLVGDL